MDKSDLKLTGMFCFMSWGGGGLVTRGGEGDGEKANNRLGFAGVCGGGGGNDNLLDNAGLE
jgi:hypothetical protein